MTRKRFAVGLTALMVLAAVVATGGIAASFEKKPQKQNSAMNQIVGSWDVTVTLLDPPPGVTPVGRALATFDSGHGTIETAAAPAALRGASQGTWARIGSRLFAVTRLFFRFNPQTGAYLGTQKINATVRVAQAGDTFKAVSVSELRDPEGNLILGGLRATAVGKRIQVERIPDQP